MPRPDIIVNKQMNNYEIMKRQVQKDFCNTIRSGKDDKKVLPPA